MCTLHFRERHTRGAFVPRSRPPRTRGLDVPALPSFERNLFLIPQSSSLISIFNVASKLLDDVRMETRLLLYRTAFPRVYEEQWARANRELSFNGTRNVRSVFLSRNLLSFHPTELVFPVNTLIKTLSINLYTYKHRFRTKPGTKANSRFELATLST